MIIPLKAVMALIRTVYRMGSVLLTRVLPTNIDKRKTNKCSINSASSTEPIKKAIRSSNMSKIVAITPGFLLILCKMGNLYDRLSMN